MEPGRPASPAGGPRPDPEPGGPDRPGASPAPRRALGPPEPAACADAGADLSAGRAPGPDVRPESAWALAPGPGTSYLLPGHVSCRDPDPDRQLPELGPLLSWTKEPEDYGPPVCPESTSLRVQGFRHSQHVRGEVDFFPAFPSPTVGEMPLDVGPGDPDEPSDFSQTCPLTSEPAACPEDGPRLRAVFDALDGDGDGFVRIEDFVQFATVYGAEQVTGRAPPGPAARPAGRTAVGECTASSLLSSVRAQCADVPFPHLGSFCSGDSLSLPASLPPTPSSRATQAGFFPDGDELLAMNSWCGDMPLGCLVEVPRE